MTIKQTAAFTLTVLSLASPALSMGHVGTLGNAILQIYGRRSLALT